MDDAKEVVRQKLSEFEEPAYEEYHASFSYGVKEYEERDFEDLRDRTSSSVTVKNVGFSDEEIKNLFSSLVR